MTDDPGRALLVRARRVYTPAATATALLIRDGRVAAVGSAPELQADAPDAESLDLGDLTVTPGFTDAHVHLVEWALARRGIDLTSADSPAGVAARVAEASAGEGWIRGRGWDPNRWSESPHREHLDAVAPARPVLLQSHDMHSLWANGAALALAGIAADTPDPEGGRIERDPDGRPTGVVRDNAMPLLYRVAPGPSRSDRLAAVLEGQGGLHRLGVTGVHTVEPDSLSLLEELAGADRLRLRVLQHLPLAGLDDAIRSGLRSGFGGPWLRIGGVKMFLDGALGSRTAWLREPYEDSDDRGVSTLDPDVFRAAAARGSPAGLAMTVHAIGDAATDLALDVLMPAGADLVGPVPHRIEHAQLLGPDRLLDAAAAGVVCSVQPSHLMTDWRAADRHWGARARYAYPFRSLVDAGTTLALGSDAPVEPPDPRQGFYAATTRRDLEGAPPGGWYPEERISAAETLAGYTTGPARAAGDARQGRLAPGSFADLVAWDLDLLEAEPDALLRGRARLTMVGGEVVWMEG